MNASAKKLLKADIALVVAFGAMSLLGAYLHGEYILQYSIAFGSYVAAKILSVSFCRYEKFADLIGKLENSSKIESLPVSGFGVFKGLLVIMIAIGYILLSFWFLIGEAVLVVAMRFWAKISKL